MCSVLGYVPRGTAVYHTVLLGAFCLTEQVGETGDRWDRAWRFFSLSLSYNNMRKWVSETSFSVFHRGWCRQESQQEGKGLSPRCDRQSTDICFWLSSTSGTCSPSSLSTQLTPGWPGREPPLENPMTQTISLSLHLAPWTLYLHWNQTQIWFNLPLSCNRELAPGAPALQFTKKPVILTSTSTRRRVHSQHR